MQHLQEAHEVKSKASKNSLAQTAERAATKLDGQQAIYMGIVAVVVVAEFFLGKMGWFLMPVVAVAAGLYFWRDRQIVDLKGRATSLRVKTIHPRRDSYR